MKTTNKVFTVSMIAMFAVSAANAKIVSEAMLTKTAGTYSGTNTVEMAIGAAETAAKNYASGLAGNYATSAQGAKADSAIQSVKVNGAALTADANKAVDITVPTKVSDLTNDSGYLTTHNPIDSALSDSSTNAVQNKVVKEALDGKQASITSSAKLGADLVDDTSSTHKFVTTTEKSTWSGKQNALNSDQLAAVNSGITSGKVSTYDGYATTIAGKQDTSNMETRANAALMEDGDAMASTTKYPSMATMNHLIGEAISDLGDGRISSLENTAVKHTTGTAVGSATLPVYVDNSGNATAITSLPFNKVSSTPTTLSGYGITDAVPSSRTVNSKALSSNVTLNGADVKLDGYTKASAVAEVAATDTINQAFGKVQKTLDAKANTADLGAAAAKGVDTSVTASSTSTNVPTTAAVASLVSTQTAASNFVHDGTISSTETAKAPSEKSVYTALSGKQDNLPAIPQSPSTDGQYVLTAKVVNNATTYSWEDIGR